VLSYATYDAAAVLCFFYKCSLLLPTLLWEQRERSFQRHLAGLLCLML